MFTTATPTPFRAGASTALTAGVRAPLRPLLPLLLKLPIGCLV